MDTNKSGKSTKATSIDRTSSQESDDDSARGERKLSRSVSTPSGKESSNGAGNPSAKNISLSPFSLSINKKVSMAKVEGVGGNSNVVSTSASPQLKDIASPSLTTSLLKDPNMTPRQQIQELQREITNLKKEMDSKDAKLSSSMRSIKMFWSPELKKERAVRKEETEKYLAAKEQYNKTREDLQKQAIKVKDLETQLVTEQKLNKEHILNQATIEEQTNLKVQELQKVKDEKAKCEDENVTLQNLVSQLEENVKTLADEVERKNRTLENLASDKVEAERDAEAANKCVEASKEELQKARRTAKDKDAENEQLMKDVERLQRQETKLKQSLDSKESENHDLQKQVRKLKEEADELKKERERRLQQNLEDEDAQEMLRNEVMALQMKVDTYETNGAVKDAEMVSLQSLIESLESKATLQLEKLEQFEITLESKDAEARNLENEVCSLSTVLAEKEVTLRQKEELISSMSSKSSVSNKELELLKEALEKKEKDVLALDAKYEKLDNYVCEREKALAQSREEVNHLRSAHAKCSTAISILEGQLKEKGELITQLGLDFEKLEKENMELDELLKTRSERNKDMDTIGHASKASEDLIKQLESKANELTMKIEEQESNIDNQNRLIREKDNTIEELNQDIRKAHDTINKLENEVKFKAARIKDLESKEISTIDDDKENVRPSSQGPHNKTMKQLWDEISKKDNKITDLEKQLKEKGKLLSVRRRSETMERGKEAQQFSEQLKQKDEVEAKVTDLQDQLDKKDNRVAVLEDALRESVSIAAEREDLLAQHVEMSEKAARKIQELESEVDRATMEKAITNIKNAFLILSVSEKDSVLALLKANRKRNLEELLKMKQRALEASISEKDINIAYLEQVTSSKSKKQEAKLLMQEKTRLLNELKEQTQIRMTLLNNEENKEGSLAKELSDGSRDQILEALRQVTDSSDKLEFYIEDLLTFIKEKNLELLKEMPTLPQRTSKTIERLKNSGKTELLKELEKLGNESAQLKSYVDSILDKLEG